MLFRYVRKTCAFTKKISHLWFFSTVERAPFWKFLMNITGELAERFLPKISHSFQQMVLGASGLLIIENTQTIGSICYETCLIHRPIKESSTKSQLCCLPTPAWKCGNGDAAVFLRVYTPSRASPRPFSRLTILDAALRHSRGSTK